MSDPVIGRGGPRHTVGLSCGFRGKCPGSRDYDESFALDDKMTDRGWYYSLVHETRTENKRTHTRQDEHRTVGPFVSTGDRTVVVGSPTRSTGTCWTGV